MTFLSPVLLVGLILLVAYLTKLNDNRERIVVVLNESDFFQHSFAPTPDLAYLPFNRISLQQAKDSVVTLDYYALIYLPNKNTIEQVAANAFLYTKESPDNLFLNQVEAVFEKELQRSKMAAFGLSELEYKSIEQKFDLNTSTFEGEINLKGLQELKYGIGGLFGYLLMMFIVIYGGLVMRSVIEEKTSRIIEIIVSSVKPFYLMLGKILGTALAGLTQFLIWIVSALLLFSVAFFVFDLNPDLINTPPPTVMQGLGEAGNLAPNIQLEKEWLYAKEVLQLPWALILGSFVIYFILGYLIYSSIYAAIGAAVDNETDTQQFIFPIILPLILAIYVGFFSVFNNPHGPIAVAFSLFPLTSPIVMLMRLPGGLGEVGVPVWQFILSIFLLILTFLSIVWLAAKIYRVGILTYGKKPNYKTIFKWLRYG